MSAATTLKFVNLCGRSDDATATRPASSRLKQRAQHHVGHDFLLLSGQNRFIEVLPAAAGSMHVIISAGGHLTRAAYGGKHCAVWCWRHNFVGSMGECMFFFFLLAVKWLAYCVNKTCVEFRTERNGWTCARGPDESIRFVFIWILDPDRVRNMMGVLVFCFLLYA